MMKNRLLSLLLIIAAACGAPIEYGAEPDLGTLEEPYVQRHGQVYAFGTQTGNPHKQCTLASTSQVCSIPLFRVIEFAFEVGNTFTLTEQVTMSNIAGRLDNATNFTFLAVNANDPVAAGAMRVMLKSSVCSGTLSNNIDGYSCPALLGATAMNEGAGINWSVVKHDSCIGNLDPADIRNKGASTIEDLRLFEQASAHVFQTCMGLGSREDAGANNFLSRRTLDLSKNLNTLTANEICRANGYTTTALDPLTITKNPTDCTGVE